MIENEYYKERYKTAEARALYLVARKGYGSLQDMAEALGFTKAFYHGIFLNGLPEKYAGYLGRRFEFPPGLLAFDKYVQLLDREVKYTALLEQTKFFNSEDKAYILHGSYLKDAAKFQRALDKGIKK